jgi:predicted nicotinamide N-methyase
MTPDGLRLVAVPFVPEVRLHLAGDAILLGARLEAKAGRRLAPPFWADAWVGGRAVARYVLDHPDLVAGRRVLDVASGSGLVAIAAAMAGAAAVTANDIDPYALDAIALNASANGVAVDLRAGDVLGMIDLAAEHDVVLAGDVFYSAETAPRMLTFLRRAESSGARVLIGDPGRAHLPRHRFETVAEYPVSNSSPPQDALVTHVQVLRLTATA